MSPYLKQRQTPSCCRCCAPESMQNLVTFGFTVFSTCRVSPAKACAAHKRAVGALEVKRHAYRAVSVGFCVLEGGRLSDMRGSYVYADVLVAGQHGCYRLR